MRAADVRRQARGGHHQRAAEVRLVGNGGAQPPVCAVTAQSRRKAHLQSPHGHLAAGCCSATVAMSEYELTSAAGFADRQTRQSQQRL